MPGTYSCLLSTTWMDHDAGPIAMNVWFKHEEHGDKQSCAKHWEEVDLLDDIMGWLLLFFGENQMQLCWKSLAATRMLLIDTDAGPRVLVPCAKSQYVEQWVGVKIESLWTFSRFGQRKGPGFRTETEAPNFDPFGNCEKSHRNALSGTCQKSFLAEIQVTSRAEYWKNELVLPSGKRLHHYGNHHFQWVNPL